MKKKGIVTAIFIIVANIATAQNKAAVGQSCKVTYIANEGFMIETKNHKVIIDGFFGNIKGKWCDTPGDSVSELMIKGSKPFGDVEIVCVTHKHSDHFNAQMLIDFLKNNKSSVLICPFQVNEIMMKNTDYPKVSERIHSIRSRNIFDTSLTINNVKIRALRLNHGAYMETDSFTGNKYDIHSGVENLGYIIEADSFAISHSGDGSPSNKEQYVSYKFPEKEFDVMMVDRTFFKPEGQDLMNNYFHTKNLVFMHIGPGKAEYYKSIIANIPEMTVFTRRPEEKIFSK